MVNKIKQICALIFAALLAGSSFCVSAEGTSYSGTITTDNVDSVSFENTYSVCNLVIQKSVEGIETEEEFSFTVSFSGLAEGYVLYTTEGKIVADEDGNAESTFTLADDESITIQGIPAGAVYTVSEAAAGSYRASYEITDAAEKGSITESSGEALIAGLGLSTQKETADDGEEITITFTNTYTVLSELPSTGGIGRTVIVCSAFAGMTALFLFLIRKKKAVI